MDERRDGVMTQEEAESRLWTETTSGIPLFMNNTLTIAPDRHEEFVAALRDVLPRARAEPTCLYLHVGQDVTDPSTFVLSEGWSDLVEFRDVVLRKDFYQRYLATSESAYARPRRVTMLSPVEPAGVGDGEPAT